MTKEIPQVDLDLIDHYASMHPSDPRFVSAFPTDESKRILEIAKHLMEEDYDT